MDPVTHTFTGAALARSGLDRATPLATATLVLAANAPDVDILSYVGGPYFALATRRGLTHGLPAMVALPFVVAGLMLAWDRWIRRRRRPGAPPARPGPLLVLASVGLLTHPVLDWMNTYGMRWWMPFDDAWSYGDALFIVDPWLWLLLGGAVFLSGRWRLRGRVGWGLFGALATALLVATPLPHPVKTLWLTGVVVVLLLRLFRPPPSEGRRARATSWALMAAILYVGAMVASDMAASREVRAALETLGVTGVEAVMVAPLPADPLGGEVVVRVSDGYLPGEHRWTGSPRVRLHPGAIVPRVEAADAIPESVERIVTAAGAHPDARDFLRWSRFPFYRVEMEGENYVVRIGDARYAGRGAGSLGGLTVRLDPSLRPVVTRD